MPTTVVWFHRDLRLADHAALAFAAARGAVVPVFVWAPYEEAPHAPGGAARWWLYASQTAFDASLRAVGSRLVVCHGPSAEALLDVVHATGADTVVWQARPQPHLARRDADVRDRLADAGFHVRTFAGALLHDPEAIRTGGGTPYRVFTPFWRRVLSETNVPEPQPASEALAAPDTWPASESLDVLGLTPAEQDGVDWAGGVRDAWTPGEAGAAKRLATFVAEGLDGYGGGRDRPDRAFSSALSPHLAHGEVSPRQVWRAASGGPPEDVAKLRAELGWREFAYHVLHHAPETVAAPMNAAYRDFPWRDDPGDLTAWQRGHTGVPFVDAAMRQLWAVGWVHNRARMVAASFLTKHLLLPWTAGAAWFSDTLVDADLASNTMGWQWVAGTGADAQPFFRIFHPVAQGERFDPDGAYVRRWVPELARLPARWIHRPHEAPADVLAKAGVEIGATYPAPIVEHGFARRRALDALAAMRDPASS